MLKPDIMERFESFTSTALFDVKMAKLTNPIWAEHKADGIGGALKLGRLYEAPSLSLQFSVGHSRASLATRLIKEAAKALLSIHTQDKDTVTRLRVSGFNEEGDDGMEPLDLLKARLYFKESVVLSVLPDTNYQTRRVLIEQIWTDNKKALGRHYKVTPK